MVKKSFRGVDAILGGLDQNDPGISTLESLELNRSINNEKNKQPREEAKTTKGSSDVRSTMIFNYDHLDSLRALAYWERKSMKMVLEDALSFYFGLKGEEYMNKALTSWQDQQK